MTTTILAHFDGKVFVPDQPVDVPVGMPLRVHVEAASPEAVASGDVSALLSRLPLLHLPPEDAEAINRDPEFSVEES